MESDTQRSNYRITDLMETERPRERLAHLGAEALSDAELLAILLRVGIEGENAVQMGQRLLKCLGGITGIHTASFDEVVQQHGLGMAKAAQLKAAIEIGRRLTINSPQTKPVISSPQDAVNLVQYEMSLLESEELRIVLLDTRNRVLRVETVYRGSVNSSQVRVGELFKAAIRSNASSLIIIHNHPSGDATPSVEDITVTRAIIQAGKLLDIDVLDHLVIGRNDWTSLKEKKLAFV